MVVMVPPVAATYFGPGAFDCRPESVTIHPFVASINTNVTAIPSVDKIESEACPPILELFLPSVKLAVSKVAA